MYVFSVGFWLPILVLALVHAVSGRRLQRWLLFLGGLVLYASFGTGLLVVLATVIVVTWIGVRAPHYTDDQAMLRFVRAASAVLAFVPLTVLRLTDDSVDLASTVLGRLSVDTGSWAVEGLIPIGVAFYTLQAIDGIYGSRTERDQVRFIDHALFVSFFPTVIIGPVQRYRDLAPQLRERRSIRLADIDAAARYIVFGLFWKFVIADNLLPITDRAFADPSIATGSQVVVGALAFAIGITADLAGYSAVVVGVARLFGVRLPSINVNRPYLARSPIDFWRRWLTTVSDWMYRRVYLGLGGTDRRTPRSALALAAAFLVGTWWHGERLTVLVFGFLHFLAVTIQIGARSRRAPSTSPVTVGIKTLFTFGFVSYAWIWFRSPTIRDALVLHLRLTSPGIDTTTVGALITILLFATLLIVSDQLFIDICVRESRAPAAEPVPWRSGSTVRGLAFASMISGILVFSTVDLHTSVMGLL